VKLAALTLSDGNPLALERIRSWQRRQVEPPDEWYFAVEAREGPATKAYVAKRYVEALEFIPPDWAVAVMEHDDYYGPEYLQLVRAALERGPMGQPREAASTIIAPWEQRHWHVSGHWHSVRDCAKHGGRCEAGAETALTYTTILPGARERVLEVLRTGKVNCAAMWSGEEPHEMPWPVVAIKGIRGTGASSKHSLHYSRKRGHVWHEDAGGSQLRWWIGEDADAYLQGDLV
jgi:hypothetical protein